MKKELSKKALNIIVTIIVVVVVVVYIILAFQSCQNSSGYDEKYFDLEYKYDEKSRELSNLQDDYAELKDDKEMLESYVIYLEMLLDENGIERH